MQRAGRSAFQRAARRPHAAPHRAGDDVLAHTRATQDDDRLGAQLAIVEALKSGGASDAGTQAWPLATQALARASRPI